MKNLKTLQIIVAVLPLLLNSCYTFYIDPPASITNVEWKLSEIIAYDQTSGDILISIPVEGGDMQTSMTFNNNGTFYGITPYMMYMSNTPDQESNGNWKLNQSNNELQIWMNQEIRDTLKIISLTDSLMEVQLTPFINAMVNELIGMLDEDEGDVRVTHKYKNIGFTGGGGTNPEPGDPIAGKMKDPRDGIEYITVKIGNQIWMAENLAFLPYILYNPDQSSYEEPMAYVYDLYDGDDESAVYSDSWKTYGTLYNWTMAQEVCPDGWRLPSLNDWEILENEVGGKSIAGKALKEEGTAHWLTPNGGTNSSGFTALPGGFVYTNASKYADQGKVGLWWTSDEYSSSEAYRRDLSYNQFDLGKHTILKSHGYSVRCIKEAVDGETMIDSRDGTEYRIVTIGNQVWMAENLAYIPFNENVNYPTDQLDPDEVMQKIPRYYVYNHYYPHRKNVFKEENFKTYGVLYNWYAAENACPSGWHLPSNEEWIILGESAGGKTVSGKKLKATGNEYWWEYATPVDNSTGFSALPGGFVNAYDKEYKTIGMHGYWWTSTEYGTTSAAGKTSAMRRDLSYNQTDLGEHDSPKTFGYSIRCVKD
jgi:uncharacterized protein (TIGR02145 family)